MRAGQREPVSLVGAGPGHPGLLTLLAADRLSRADLVVHDALVPPRLLEQAPPSARLVCVRDLQASHCARTEVVCDLLIEAWQQGKRVVRLKGGDPFLFGRGGEEADYLAARGVPFEVVPGVTAALGAAAFAGLPLTHRGLGSAVTFVTGHEDPAKANGLDWAALATFPGTLVVYMGLARLPAVVAGLLRHGKDPATPAAVIQWA